MLIGPWAAMGGPRKGTTGPHSMWQDWPPGLKVGSYWGPALFHPGPCLPPAAVHGAQAACTKGHLQARVELPSAPLSFLSHVHGHSDSGGGQGGRALVCQHCPEPTHIL